VRESVCTEKKIFVFYKLDVSPILAAFLLLYLVYENVPSNLWHDFGKKNEQV